jgi:hypothetical protein
MLRFLCAWPRCLAHVHLGKLPVCFPVNGIPAIAIDNAASFGDTVYATGIDLPDDTGRKEREFCPKLPHVACPDCRKVDLPLHRTTSR